MVVATLKKKKKQYRVTGVGSKCRTEVKTARHSVVTDTPAKDGGTDVAAEPVETLLAALVGCEQATAHWVARILRFRIDRIEFDVQASRDPRGAIALPVDQTPPVPSRLEKVWGTATVYAQNATPEDIRKLGTIVHTRCPVASMITLSGCALEVEWYLGSSSRTRE
ncbi:hypothetical protein CTAYLR_010801 [Chrysophaeum taylorii]|uniref:OsmC-like protein n=1 Tax=Chrysophaeum taylorii TaxID=2483200 RepID=A0AAD7UIW4_9STRA|nr:hypothetical protein CTAYLR_010801 [Chrysophaeum taylorii]